MDPRTLQPGASTPVPMWRGQMPTMELARPTPMALPMPLPTPTSTPMSAMASPDSSGGFWPRFRTDSRLSDSFLNRTSDAVLGGMAKIGAWAEKNIPEDDAMDVYLSVPGSIASTQEALEGTESLASNVGMIRSSGITRFVATTGAIIDAGTGVLDVAKAIKQDRDAGDPTYSRTLKASVIPTTSMVIGTAVGIGVASLVGGPVVAPLIVGGLVAAGVSYGVKKLLSFF